MKDDSRQRQSAGIRQLSFGIFCLLAASLHADTLVLKSGLTATGKSFRRQGDVILVTVEIPGPDGRPMTAERSTPLAEILKVECVQPEALKTAPALLAAGKAASVLPAADAAAKLAEPFGDLPGSYWPALIVLKAHTLLGMGKDAEAAALATTMRNSANADLARDARAVEAVIAARKGDHGTAAALAAPLLKEATRPSTIAAAAVARGLGYLQQQQFQEALKAFLELPVFTPDETALSGMAQLGAAQAYYGMADYDRAIATLQDLIMTQPGSSETPKAQTLLPEWQRRRTAVNAAKAP
ncbi:MAG: hypothetical protein K9N47_10400 [Prosthecobacter sp.]|uniref:tetratricopeptide repeat protein n=1 Tax=Prosthecobacter sp. TaxID=1965333 RepID=UPI0025FE6FF1|nr:hypothetical protein [Prosthecobacter sp.]MCF7786523.1 hypothetical protein [Prosthecobacter sp.]